MNKDNVDVQDYLDDMADGFVGDEATNEEYEQAQALVSQAFCFGIERKQQEIESLKAQLAQYQSDDWISVKDRLPENGQEVFAVDSIISCQFVDGEFVEEFYEFDTGHSYEEAVDARYWKPSPQAIKEQDSE